MRQSLLVSETSADPFALLSAGYSKWAFTQEQALAFRLEKEPGVEKPAGMVPDRAYAGRSSFFPQTRKR
jgi:hypothetical protein